MVGSWIPHRDGDVMIDVEYLDEDVSRGLLHAGSEGHLSPDYARAELWWLEWQRRHTQLAVATVRFTEV